MPTGFSVNPGITTAAPGMFGIETSGYIQGLTMDDPTVRNWLSGGVVAATETAPMWGGMAISEKLPTGYVTGTSAGPKAMGGPISRATALTGSFPITGFSVFDQAHHMMSTPQSQVPMAAQGDSVHFYRLGTRARVPVNCDAQLVSLLGGLNNAQVSWDFVAQRLVPYTAAAGTDAITAATYNSGTGLATYTTAAAHGLVPGNDVSIVGMTPAGYNGSFTTLSGTTGSTIVVALPVAPGGSGTAFGNVAGGGGALPVTILDVAPTNCMTVQYDPITGFASWNRNGACALILI